MNCVMVELQEIVLTLVQPILDILAEMIAVDPSISVSGSSSDAGHPTVE